MLVWDIPVGMYSHLSGSGVLPCIFTSLRQTFFLFFFFTTNHQPPTTHHPPPTTHHPPPTTHHPPPQPFFRCRAGTARSCTFSRHVQVASVRIVFNCMKLFAFFNFLDTFSCIFLCRCILFFVLSTGLTLRHNAP